jgi:DsbC/DsbD-like thiol-disulfide interchange protein
MKIIVPFVLSTVIASPMPVAHAEASEWHEVEGGAVRFLTQGVPDAEGKLRAALEIRLKPGWKTYWVDPGSSGVPPTLEVSADGAKIATTMHFPVPVRFDDGYAQWAGYDRSVALATELDLSGYASSLPLIEAYAFLGMCETICIPVQATFTLDLSGGNRPAEDAAVDVAFANLPEPAHNGFGIESVSVEETGLVARVSVPQGALAQDLYVAGTDRLMFDAPVLNEARTEFSVPFMGHGKPKGGEKLLYTLRTSTGNVTGHLTLP